MIRRFYKEVTLAEVPGGWQVLLDGREVKTVGGAPQIAPTRALGEALASEWRRQGDKIDPGSLPLRDLADYAIDVVALGQAAVADSLIGYAETDTLCYRADPDEPLHARQLEVWEPLLARFEADNDVRLVRVSGVLHRPQPPETLAALRTRLALLDPFALAGVVTMTTLAASLVTALAALDAREDDARALWQAACLEEEWQAELWGREEEAEERRARREADFLRACGFVRLVRS